eukprot:CAMPEP_0179298466 /NCGR_PEP_ID=MMETSP0797-20121207/46005_1 /TAXON_ID=47934 /ORGANISM="Dinophysis acuminata, Strain DAEP01" /LENGTH=178 /DNA_ID=CAMNT_0021007849 /DNA_START=223 /DNA_END=754 /DNA_ORIENTATION=-
MSPRQRLWPHVRPSSAASARVPHQDPASPGCSSLVRTGRLQLLLELRVDRVGNVVPGVTLARGRYVLYPHLAVLHVRRDEGVLPGVHHQREANIVTKPVDLHVGVQEDDTIRGAVLFLASDHCLPTQHDPAVSLHGAQVVPRLLQPAHVHEVIYGRASPPSSRATQAPLSEAAGSFEA